MDVVEKAFKTILVPSTLNISPLSTINGTSFDRYEFAWDSDAAH